MAMSNAKLKRRLNAGSLLILAAGLVAAALIYLTAADVPENALGYAVVNGTVYPLAAGDSKTYRHQLERYGGKMNVVLDDFMRWFAGLWQGKSLAKTVAWLSALVSLAICLFANSLPDNPDFETRNAGNRDKPEP